MRKLLIIALILSLMLVAGCASNNAQVDVTPDPEPASPAAPDLAQVDPEEPAPAPEPEPEQEIPGAATETLGNRVTGTEPEVVEEELPEEAVEEGAAITLDPDKTMSETEATIKAGTTLYWKNMDGDWPHVLAVETGSGWDTIRHAKSEQIKGGEVWEYTFEETGTFLVRDLFSGKMRMTVTVE